MRNYEKLDKFTRSTPECNNFLWKKLLKPIICPFRFASNKRHFPEYSNHWISWENLENIISSPGKSCVMSQSWPLIGYHPAIRGLWLVGCIRGMCNPCQEIDSTQSGFRKREFLLETDLETSDITLAHTQLSSQPHSGWVRMKIETLWARNEPNISQLSTMNGWWTLRTPETRGI